MAVEMPQGYETYFKYWEEKIGAFTEFFADSNSPLLSSRAGKVIPFGLKNNIALEGFSYSCASKLLKELKAPYTASVVKTLIDRGFVPVGMTNMDEFAMGATTDTSAIKKTNNPWDSARVAGGSSGGSAAAVAAGLVPFALGSDTGGSVRQPAAFCGVVGLKPTYGAVSRNGLAALASSFDVVGILSDTVSRCREVFGNIAGRDSKDATSMDAPKDAPPLYGAETRGHVVGVLSDKSLEEAAAGTSGKVKMESEVLKGLDTAKENLAALGYTIKEVELPCLKYAAPAFHTICAAEASANMARFDGIRFGKRPEWADNPDDLVDKARVSGLGDEVKLRILLGTYVLRSGLQDQYYLPALRIREGIRRAFETLLGDGEYSRPADYDALLLPVFPFRAFTRGAFSPACLKAANVFTSCVSLAGLPALSFPASLEGGLPVGVQIVGRSFAEGALFDIAERYEKTHPFPHPEGYKKFWSED